MTQPDGELSPPFEVIEPPVWRAPIIFNSPHSGSVYPSEFLTASRIDLASLRDARVIEAYLGHGAAARLAAVGAAHG